MKHASLQAFLSDSAAVLARGPIALILIEDMVEVESTIRHHLSLGFRAVLVLAPSSMTLPDDLAGRVHHIVYNTQTPGALTNAINPIIAAIFEAPATRAASTRSRFQAGTWRIFPTAEPESSAHRSNGSPPSSMRKRSRPVR